MLTGYRLLIYSFFLIGYLTCYAQDKEEPTFRLYLIGDAGEGDTSGPTLLDLQSQLYDNPKSAVVFLGDNCYKKMFFGLFDPEMKGFDGRKITKRRMMTQLNMLKDYKGYAYFIPGNHDWWNLIALKSGKKIC